MSDTESLSAQKVLYGSLQVCWKQASGLKHPNLQWKVVHGSSEELICTSQKCPHFPGEKDENKTKNPQTKPENLGALHSSNKNSSNGHW